MEFSTPIPPPIPITGGFDLPEPILVQPRGQEFQWEPVPMYVEDIPNPIPAPQPRPAVPEDSSEEELEEEQQEKEEKSVEETKDKPSSGKPPANLVPEIAEVQTVELPVIGIEIPLPRTEILVTATTTAGVSSVVAVGGTLFATTLFRQLQPILKPIFKTLLKKLAALRKKPPPLSWSRQRLIDRRSAVVKKQ